MKKCLFFFFLQFFLVKYSHSQTALNLSALPLQITVNEGGTAVYNFNGSITSIESRNPGLVNWTINGTSVTFTGLKSGRTGLKITSSGLNYYLGMRINHSNGSRPGLPSHLSIASVSEDATGDLAYWKDINPGLKNKAMDIRYIYINGGPFLGWSSWGIQRPGKYARESLRHGLIPFFVYYNIPDGGESYSVDLAHVQDPAYMTAYFNDLTMFMDSVENVMKGELYGIILEPDFLGYMQQNASPNDPLLIPTAVGPTSIATNAGNITTLVQRINKTIQNKRNSGSNLFFGWQQNLWAYSAFQGTQGVIRRTDDFPLPAAKYLIEHTAREATLYQLRAGILSFGADFISIDKYGFDAMGHQNTPDPAKSTWFWNNDHWNNYLLYAKTIHETSSKPIVLWQMPVGHVNGSTYMSAYTNAVYADLPNTNTKYEDSSTDFFLGDTLNITDATRLNYFKQNLWNDSKIVQSGNKLYWQNHLKECKDAGIISVQFGAGIGPSTTGIGNPPTDNYFWVQKVQQYYLNPIKLNNTYGEGPLNPCTGGCSPIINFVYPVNNQTICRTLKDTAKLNFMVMDQDGSISTLVAKIDGNVITTDVLSQLQQIKWSPITSWGNHTLTVTATDNSGLTNTQSINFSINYSDPTDCGYPEWNASTVYNNANTLVTYNGLIFKNKYYTQNERPYMGGASSAWTLAGVCPCTANTIGINSPSEISQQFITFPNPAHDLFFINVKTTELTRLQIFDLKGVCAMDESVQAGINEYSIHNLSNGFYILKLSGKNTSYFQKLIKE